MISLNELRNQVSLAAAARGATGLLRNIDTGVGSALMSVGKAIPTALDRSKVLSRAPFGVVSLAILFKAVKYNKEQSEKQERHLRASYLEGERNRVREQAAMERTINQMRASTNAQLVPTLAQKGVSSAHMMMGGDIPRTAVAAMVARAAKQDGARRWR